MTSFAEPPITDWMPIDSALLASVAVFVVVEERTRFSKSETPPVTESMPLNPSSVMVRGVAIDANEMVSLVGVSSPASVDFAAAKSSTELKLNVAMIGRNND